MSANRLSIDVVMDRDVRKGDKSSVVGSPALPLVPLDVSVGDP